MLSKGSFESFGLLSVKDVVARLDLSQLFLGLLGVGLMILFADYAWMMYMHRRLVGLLHAPCWIVRADRIATWSHTFASGWEHAFASRE